MSMLAAIADAVTADLNAATFSPTFTAARLWYVNYTLVDLQSLRVSVVPAPLAIRMATRGDDIASVQVDIAIQKKVDPRVNAEIDPLVGLFEAMIDHFKRRHLVATSGVEASCTTREPIPGTEAGISPDLLKEWRAFLAVLRTTWVITKR